MEQHPVPQNVTAFEFHLIGDMTLRQFGYLASGCVIAYLTFIFLRDSAPLLAWPIIFTSMMLGTAFAFLPIADRPLDHWLTAFLRAIYSPTQGSWQLAIPAGSQLSSQQVFQNRLNLYLQGLQSLPLPQTPIFPAFPNTKNVPTVSGNPSPSLPPETEESKTALDDLPSAKELDQLVEAAEKIQVLKNKISETEKQLDTLRQASQTSGHIMSEDQFKKLSEHLQNLLSQTEEIHHKTVKDAPKATKPKPTKVVVVQAPQEVTKPVLLTSLPNVINGIVSDEAGNSLEGVIVIVHNKDGLPVRALKTNKLGQFTGTTPLPQGIYTITLEKDNLEFDTLQVTLSGELLSPLKIYPKKGVVGR